MTLESAKQHIESVIASSTHVLVIEEMGIVIVEKPQLAFLRDFPNMNFPEDFVEFALVGDVVNISAGLNGAFGTRLSADNVKGARIFMPSSKVCDSVIPADRNVWRAAIENGKTWREQAIQAILRVCEIVGRNDFDYFEL